MAPSRVRMLGVCFALGLLALPGESLILPGALQAQATSRFQVLIPYFQPRNDSDDDFGKDASEKLREWINTLLTHVAMDKDEIEDQLEQFDIDIDDLTCLQTIQLAAQINVPVAICASYTERPDETWVVDASIQTIETSEEFVLEQFEVARGDEDEAAAQQIFDQFDRYNSQLRAAVFCNDYAASQQWDDALRNCDESLAINPNSVATRFLRARILYELERHAESLDELERVLVMNPFHDEGLQLAGYIATVAGDDDAGRDYYSRYLDINPGNVVIRMRIAFELAQAGDPVGAMQFIQVGLDVDPENVDLLDQYGGFAFVAALEAQEAYELSMRDAEGLAPEAAGYYREAIEAYTKVFDARGADTPPERLRNIIAAYIQLEEPDSAIATSERVLETHAQDDRIWSFYADALQRTGRLDDAIVALDRLLEVNPEHATARLRQASWLIEASRLEDAVTILSEVAENPVQADEAARMIFAEAYTHGFQEQNFEYTITGMAAASRLSNLSDAMTRQVTFWHGFSLYQATIREQEPGTLESPTAATSPIPTPMPARIMPCLRTIRRTSRRSAPTAIRTPISRVR